MDMVHLFNLLEALHREHVIRVILFHNEKVQVNPSLQVFFLFCSCLNTSNKY